MEQIIYDMEKREDKIRKILAKRDWFEWTVDNWKPKKKKPKKRLKTKHDKFIDKIYQKISSIPDGYIGG